MSSRAVHKPLHVPQTPPQGQLSCWDDAALTHDIKALHRKNIIMAGLTTDIWCAKPPLGILCRRPAADAHTLGAAQSSDGQPGSMIMYSKCLSAATCAMQGSCAGRCHELPFSTWHLVWAVVSAMQLLGL